MIKVKPIIDNRRFNQDNFFAWLCGDTKNFGDCWKREPIKWKNKLNGKTSF